MPLIVTYKDTRHHHAVQCDDIATGAILQYFAERMIIPSAFNLLEINLTDDIESVNCWQQGHCVCSFGGSIAWDIYKCICTIWPDINYHSRLTTHDS